MSPMRRGGKRATTVASDERQAAYATFRSNDDDKIGCGGLGLA